MELKLFYINPKISKNLEQTLKDIDIKSKSYYSTDSSQNLYLNDYRILSTIEIADKELKTNPNILAYTKLDFKRLILLNFYKKLNLEDNYDQLKFFILLNHFLDVTFPQAGKTDGFAQQILGRLYYSDYTKNKIDCLKIDDINVKKFNISLEKALSII